MTKTLCKLHEIFETHQKPRMLKSEQVKDRWV
ncbi:hypothetical protein RRG08_030126 [Elysia crispata]|uniref:Uncharacterized protein n=1 Tax=Elysia crispata TaxID=231223 RepID=A0AAE1DKG4_9GAST|nr:hypothetical protein RRG08_030126 [Elysia crispata]